jgi:hypothetical protein
LGIIVTNLRIVKGFRLNPILGFVYKTCLFNTNRRSTVKSNKGNKRTSKKAAKKASITHFLLA